MEIEVKHKFSVFIRAKSAENGPPLSTVLGNIGVNTVKFIKEFNDFTKDLPVYFLLKVHIYIFEDRSLKFFVFLPSTGYFLSILKVSFLSSKNPKQNVSDNKYFIYLKNIVQLALFKFPGVCLQKSVIIIIGSLNSSNIFIK